MNYFDIESQIRSDPFNPIHHIALSKAYLEEGDEEQARKVVAIKRRLPSQDPSVHFEWGRLCEELGMARQARESYEQAVTLDPKNPDYPFRLALLYQEKGAWERTLKYLQKTVSLSPQNNEAKAMLVCLYEEMGFKGSAIAVHGRQKKADLVFEISSFEISEEDGNTLLNLFQGREFGYAVDNLSGVGIANPTLVKGVLGLNEIRSHLRGEETYGVYPLRADRTLKFTCIHIAIPWRKVLENVRNEGFLALLEQKAHQYAREIIKKSHEYEIPAYLENSGARDRRIWFFFEEFIPKELAERFVNALLDRTLAPPSDIMVALFLGIQGKGIGYEAHPVMLPLGFNRRTGKRCFFINEDGAPYEDQLLMVKKIRPINRGEIQQFIMSAEKRRYDWEHMEFDPLRRLQKNCPVLGDLIRKAGSGRILRHEEKMVVFFTLGFLNDHFLSLHRVLEPCPDYRPKKVDRLASRLKSNPISCPKIRELLPETTAYLPCNCSFVIREGSYPSPLLHIDHGLVPLKTERLSPSRPEDLIKEYNVLNEKIEELTKKRDELKWMLGNM